MNMSQYESNINMGNTSHSKSRTLSPAQRGTGRRRWWLPGGQRRRRRSAARCCVPHGDVVGICRSPGLNFGPQGSLVSIEWQGSAATCALTAMVSQGISIVLRVKRKGKAERLFHGSPWMKFQALHGTLGPYAQLWQEQKKRRCATSATLVMPECNAT